MTAKVFGITNKESAKACTPNFALPLADFLISPLKWAWAAISNEPAPGINDLSSNAFLIDLNPSLIASEIWAMVWLFGPIEKGKKLKN